jgi:hypothetical protein
MARAGQFPAGQRARAVQRTPGTGPQRDRLEILWCPAPPRRALLDPFPERLRGDLEALQHRLERRIAGLEQREEQVF